jgi:hypothetical protein
MQRTGVRPSLLNLSNDARTKRKIDDKGKTIVSPSTGVSLLLLLSALFTQTVLTLFSHDCVLLWPFSLSIYLHLYIYRSGFSKLSNPFSG